MKHVACHAAQVVGRGRIKDGGQGLASGSEVELGRDEGWPAASTSLLQILPALARGAVTTGVAAVGAL